MLEIKSASNQHFKYFKSLLAKKGREESGEYMVEGIKSVNEALMSGKTVSAVIVCDKKRDLADGVRDDIVYIMPEQLTDRLSDTKSPQGIFAVIKKEKKEFSPKKDGMYVFCDCISDPGNLGTIIRCADAAAFDGVLLSDGCVEVYNPKTVRACMGSFFHTDIFENINAEILKSAGANLYGGILSGDTADYRTPNYDGCTVICVGNEANGISDRVKELCIPIKIPIYGKAESLNAAVAASIMMYEAANKKHKS